MAESEEEWESLLMRVKEECAKASLKLNLLKMKIMSYSRNTPWQIDGGKVKKVADFMFLGSKITADVDCSHEIKRCLLLVTNLDRVLTSRDITLLTGLYGQSYGLSSIRVQLWELDHKEDWAPMIWCFQIVVLEKTLERPLESQEIKSVNAKINQCWIFIGRTDADAEAPILWPPDMKSWPIEKDSDAGKDWGQKKKGATENEMVGWHYQLSGHEFEQTLGDREGHGSLVCCSLWGHSIGHSLAIEQLSQEALWRDVFSDTLHHLQEEFWWVWEKLWLT